MEETIVIIEAISSAANYIHDIKELGYNPVCLELHVDESNEEKYRKLYDKHYLLLNDELPEHISAKGSYEKTLEMVKKLDPILILPGTDIAIEWATKMAYDLGLPSNNPKIIKKMVDKQHMQDALKESNLRHIRSEVINSYADAKKFISDWDCAQVVVKPSFSTATQGVCICKNEDEVKEAIDYNKSLSENNDDVYMLIQEYIGGEEFIVDSVCCEGHNRVISSFKYKKILIEGRGSIYDYTEAIDESDPYFAELKEYNDGVLSAIGLEYGVTHAEYKIDENGPVLIEINCRVSGPSQNRLILDEVWGEHATALSLESYLNPKECIKKINKPLKLLSSYIIKDLITYGEVNVKKSNVENVFSNLESFRYAISMGDNRIYPKTIDLATSAGIVFLVNKNKTKLIEDVNEIKRIEEFEVEKMFELK